MAKKEHRLISFLKENKDYGFTVQELSKKFKLTKGAIYNLKYNYYNIVESHAVGGKKHYYMIKENV